MAKFLSIEKEKGTEEQILLSLVVSTRFCDKMAEKTNLDYFQQSDYRLLAKWALEYYNKYKTAIGQKILSTFSVNKSTLSEERAEVLYHIITKLGIEFQEDDVFNYSYMTDVALKYFKKRDLQITVEKMEGFIMKDALEEAEKIRYEISPTSLDFDNFTYALSMEALEQIIEKQEYKGETFTYNGYLGNIIGDIERGMFIAFLGGPKTGKSWWLVETACQALMKKLKVVFVSLEMPEEQINKRIYQRMGSLIKPSIFLRDKVYNFPVLDCSKNQNDTCYEAYRASRVGLIDEHGNLCEFGEHDPEYKPCSYCYENIPKEFEMTSWYEHIRRPQVDDQNIHKVINSFKYLKTNLITLFYPRGTKTIQGITDQIDVLSHKHNFIPDVVLIDYLDITQGADDRHGINKIWEYFDGYTTERHIIGASVSQAGRQTKRKRNIGIDDISEEWRKVAHVNKFFGLHQTPSEKRNKLMRVGLLANREDDFDEMHQALVLQNLSAGQVCLDSYKYIAEEE